MAVQVLRRGVEDEVEPELQRALQDGGGERAVDHRGDAAAPRDFRHELEVHDLDERVRGRLDVEPAGFLPDRRLQARPRFRRDERDGDAHRLENVPEEAERPAVEVFRRDHVVAGLQVGEERSRDRAHARTEQHRVLGAFERREFFFGCGPVGVALTRVESVRRLSRRSPRQRIGSGKREGSGLEDRFGERPRGVEALARVHRLSVGAETPVLLHVPPLSLLALPALRRRRRRR